MSEESVTISKASFERMQEALAFLECLEAAGVDNWCGYGEAQTMMEESK